MAIYHINHVNWIIFSANDDSQDQKLVYPDEQGTQAATAATTTQMPGDSQTEATQKAFGATEFVVHTEILESGTPATSRGDGPNNKPKVRLHRLS